MGQADVASTDRGPSGPQPPESYEAPRLTPIGNARDLLWGGAGSIGDMGPNPDGDLPSQHS